MKRYVVIPILLAALFGAACEEEQEPDRVVGLIMKCNAYVPNGDGIELVERVDEGCEHAEERWKELTIRTSQGTAYTVKVDAASRVTVGDRWPQTLE